VEPRLEIRLFGEPAFAFGGMPWPFGAPPRALPLLAFLILHAGEPVSRARLATLFWPDDDDEAARSNLRRHLHHIARRLPQLRGATWLDNAGGSITWNLDAPATIDVLEFKRLVADPETLAQAVELYRGDFIEASHDEWLLAEQGRLRTAALAAMYELAVAARSRRNYAEAVAHCERILAFDEWREDALRTLMSVRYESGDRAAALAVYERFAMRLHAEMNVEPMPETTALRNLIVAEQPLEPASEAPMHAPVIENSGRALHLPFVGRSEPLETLRAAWMRAAHKTGTLVFVAGEPGIGKSRLAAELSSIVEGQGGRTLIGLTSSPERSPYQPLVDAVRRGLPYLAKAAIDPLWLSVLASLVPEVLGMRLGIAAAEAIEPRAARARLHEAFARAFECIARTRPLLIVVEDLHWATADTIEALAFLARRVGGMPILILVLYRDDTLETGHPLRDARRALQSEHRATTLALARLRASDIQAFVTRTREAADAPEQLSEAIFRVSEGNPLFASQLLQEYVETGALPSEDSIRELAETITTRVERLDQQTRAVADVAATIGRDFSAELVGGVGGWTENAVLDALGAMMDRRLVRETGAPGFEYCFTHVLIQSAIYNQTDAALRAKRHRRIAQLLARSSARAQLAGTIALHYESAGEHELAGRAYLEAARAALTVFARGDAIDLARRASELLASNAERFEALAVSLAAQVRHGDTQRMREEVDRLGALARTLDLEQQFIALELRHETSFLSADRERERETIDAMLALADRAGNANWRARSLYARALFLSALGRLLEAEEPLREALAIAFELRDDDLIARIRQRIVQVAIRRGDVREALHELELQRAAMRDTSATSQERLYLLNAEAACCEILEDPATTQRVVSELLDVAVRVGDVDTEAKAHAQLANAAHQRFECSAMRAHYARAFELFMARQNRQWYAVTLVNQGALEREIGNLDETIRLCTEARVLMRDVQSTDGLCTTALNIGEAEFLRGKIEPALALVQDGLKHAIDSGEKRLIAEARMINGTILCARGDIESGLEQLHTGVAMRRDLNTPRSLSDDLCTLIEALLNAEHLVEVAPLAEELEALFATGLERQRFPARVCWMLSRVARVSGDAGAADAWLTRGRDILTQQLARFDDPADVARFSALAFNQALLASAQPSGPKTRTSRRSS
jgi:predicted ATPase/DNA-binding SARP family transcriptional activator